MRTALATARDPGQDPVGPRTYNLVGAMSSHHERHRASRVRRARSSGARTGLRRLAALRLDHSPIRAWHFRYALAVFAIAMVWVSRESLLPEAGDRSPFLAFSLAVMIVALAAGFGPGLLATILSATIAAVLYLPPRLTLAVNEPFDTVRLSLFAVEGLAAAFAGGLVRRAVLREEAMSRSASRFVGFLQRVEDVRGQRPRIDEPPIQDLTEREREVARLLAYGFGNDEIADALFVSRNTVKTHLKHIYEKLAVRTRTEAVARCIELGLITGPSNDGTLSAGVPTD